MERIRYRLDEGKVGPVARCAALCRRSADAGEFVSQVVEPEGIASFVHVPITLGGRLFGVLSAGSQVPDRFGSRTCAACRRSPPWPPARSPTPWTSSASDASRWR